VTQAFEEYRIEHPADVEVNTLTPADAEALHPAVLERLATGEHSGDHRVEALSRMAYRRSGQGARAYAPAIAEILAELVAAEAASADEPAPETPSEEEPAVEPDAPSQATAPAETDAKEE
jgi:hypothetical protein